MARISIRSPDLFTGDSIQTGHLATLCILLVFTFVQFLQATSILNRPYILPRRAILYTLAAGTLLLTISYGLQIGPLVIRNSYSIIADRDPYTGYIIASLTCSNFGQLLIFLCIFLISYDRVAAYRTGAPERSWTFKKFLDGFLLGVAAILTIAYLSIYGSARVEYFTKNSLSSKAYRKEIDTSNNLSAAQGVFYILLYISILVAAIMLYGRVRAAGAADEVAKTLLFIISPIAMIRALRAFIIVVVTLVPAILASIGANDTYILAQVITGGATTLAIIGFLLRLGYRAEAWAMPPVRDSSFLPGGPVAHNGVEGWKPPSDYQPPARNAMSIEAAGTSDPSLRTHGTNPPASTTALLGYSGRPEIHDAMREGFIPDVRPVYLTRPADTYPEVSFSGSRAPF